MNKETANGDNVGYLEYIQSKTHHGINHGFNPLFMQSDLFDFQQSLVDWAVNKGRAGIFADCGLGKTPMGLTWAENVVRKTNKPVLYLTPLAVGPQTIREANKFGIDAIHSRDGNFAGSIVVSNYEKLHFFNPSDFAGVVCDESSILKSFAGTRRAEITSFMRKIEYRLLQTATAAPNDFIELGTSSEALGYLGHIDMLNKFFKNDLNNSFQGRMRGEVIKWRLKGHAELPFWRWVCSWARALRKPSDLGFDDSLFILPALSEVEHTVKVSKHADGMLFDLPAVGLNEQREERNRSINERCEKVAELTDNTSRQSLVWCHLNKEGDLLDKLMPDAVQVSGKDSDNQKEDKLTAFAEGRVRVLITKPKIGAWGLNFQNCAHVVTFPSHSYEQYYQSIRRCWRFGQTNPVRVDIVTTEGGLGVLNNMKRKSAQADEMFGNLVAEMNSAQGIKTTPQNPQKMEMPTWIQ